MGAAPGRRADPARTRVGCAAAIFPMDGCPRGGARRKTVEPPRVMAASRGAGAGAPPLCPIVPSCTGRRRTVRRAAAGVPVS